MESDPHHRKVDLQSPADFTYLLANIRASSQEKLDNALPPSAAPKDGDDVFKAKVESLVHEYINSTLTLSLPSLALNGLPASPTLLQQASSQPDASSNLTTKNDPTSPSTSFLQSTTPDDSSNYEPYDPRLAQKLRECYALLEEESTRVAELRREGPGAAGRAWVEAFQEGIREEREGQRVWEEEVLRRVRAEEEARVKGLGRVEREEEVRASWERGVQELRVLGEGLGGTVANVERAGEVGEMVKGNLKLG